MLRFEVLRLTGQYDVWLEIQLFDLLIWFKIVYEEIEYSGKNEGVVRFLIT